ncbi:MAG: hypothetical protein HYZ45_11625, partial [Burkholderiales bacterium]|nr:hypothetical protein [Burkholderiales bacterium]
MKQIPPYFLQSTRPLLLALLVTSACQVMAAERYDVDRNPVPATATFTGETA